MGRRKTISDADVTALARQVFRERGMAASTREIAHRAGVSEAVLYQRFATKDALFFAAMVPGEPDLLAIFGGREPERDPRRWLQRVVERMVRYFAGMLPVGIQLVTHPRFDRSRLGKSDPAAISRRLEEELARRLRKLGRAGEISAIRPRAAAQLLTSLAHDWALYQVMRNVDPSSERRSLGECIDVIWRGLAPASRKRAT